MIVIHGTRPDCCSRASPHQPTIDEKVDLYSKPDKSVSLGALRLKNVKTELGRFFTSSTIIFDLLREACEGIA
jgi:hypothetical protein